MGFCRKTETHALHHIERIGRGGGIRTLDILLPKQARYRAAPHPEPAGLYRTRGGQAIAIDVHIGYRSLEGKFTRSWHSYADQKYFRLDQ